MLNAISVQRNTEIPTTKCCWNVLGNTKYKMLNAIVVQRNTEITTNQCRSNVRKYKTSNAKCH